MNRRIATRVLPVLLAALCLSGCAPKVPNPFSVTIEADIAKYSPVMSSVAGFPLTARVTPEGAEHMQYVWTASGGHLEAIVGLVDDPPARYSSEQPKVLWSPDLSQPETTTSYTVQVEVRNKNGETVATDSATILRDGNLFFTLQP